MTPAFLRDPEVVGRLRRLPGARALRGAALAGVDFVEGATGRRPPMRPPRRLGSVGAGDFEVVGEILAGQLRELGGLRPDARVLDVGCGVGRVAVPLTRYLTTGRYDGFDISPRMITWCRDHISLRHPEFRFTLVDVQNTHYNPDRGAAASGVRFPYADDAFDFAFATSLFTHMVPGGFRNYVDEIGRTVQDGGTLLCTCFLLDDDARTRVARGASELDLTQELVDAETGEPFRVVDPQTPETAVGFDQAFVERTLGAAGFRMDAIHRGTWSGLADRSGYQDIVVARRESELSA